MSATQKIFLGIGIVAGIVTLGVIGVGVYETSQSTEASGYHPSDDLMNPYDLSKNPYKYKGKSGILDTLHVTLIGPNGTGLKLPYPGGGLRFEKMIDEHTATYAVLAGDQDVLPDGEIAVELDNSDPPKPTVPWRIYVIGPMDGVNGFGQDIKVSEVKFEGYYAQPTPPSDAPQSSSPVTAQPSENQASQPPANSDSVISSGTQSAPKVDTAPANDAPSSAQEPAPIERQSPPDQKPPQPNT